jgi:hypothetical protein
VNPDPDEPLSYVEFAATTEMLFVTPQSVTEILLLPVETVCVRLFSPSTLPVPLLPLYEYAVNVSLAAGTVHAVLHVLVPVPVHEDRLIVTLDVKPTGTLPPLTLFKTNLSEAVAAEM